MLTKILIALADSNIKKQVKLNTLATSKIAINQDVNVMGVSFTSINVIFNFMLHLLSHMNSKDKQQACGNMMSASCLAQARINHENIHFGFRTLTMQMCCWIVDLNYLTL